VVAADVCTFLLTEGANVHINIWLGVMGHEVFDKSKSDRESNVHDDDRVQQNGGIQDGHICKSDFVRLDDHTNFLYADVLKDRIRCLCNPASLHCGKVLVDRDRWSVLVEKNDQHLLEALPK
jgi:hypothetical protein